MLHLLRVRLYDLRFEKWLRELFGWGHLLRALWGRDPAARAAHYGSAQGFFGSATGRDYLRTLMRRDAQLDQAAWRQAVARHPSLRHAREKLPSLTRTIVLKPPLPNGEKGVLLSTFEYNWSKILLSLPPEGFRWLDQHYDLIFSTSSSPTHFAGLSLAAAQVQGTVFVQACNHQDIDVIEDWHPRLKCLPTLPCDWLNPVLFQPKPYAEKSRDITMVSFWGPVKRHWEFFTALSRMPEHLKITLIGQRDGHRTRDGMLPMARDFGVRQDIEVLESIPVAEVYEILADSKASVIMSRREGCCVAAVESLFAGCPLAMRDDAYVGPLAYINEQTGRRLRPGRIAEDLMALLAESETLSPHVWAQKNIAGHTSWQKVNGLLKEHALAQQRPWTQDIALPQWRPHPTFARPEEQQAMRPAYDELHRRFPVIFPDRLWSDSWK